MRDCHGVFVVAVVLACASGPLLGVSSPYIRQIAPAADAIVGVAGPGDKVTISFDVDMAGILNSCPLNTGQSYVKHISVRCVGPACTGGLLWTSHPLFDETTTAWHMTQAIPVDAFLKAVGAQAVPVSQAYSWTVDVGTHNGPIVDAGSVEKTCAVSIQQFVLARKAAATPTPGIPDLQLRMDPDTFTAWPTKFIVSNKGTGKSQGTFFQAKATLLDAGNEAVRANCAARFTALGPKEILELSPGASHEVPVPVDPRNLTLGMPAGPARAGNAGPAPTPNPVHQSVTCRFQIQASLGTDTNQADPNHKNDALSRTIQYDVPYDPNKKTGTLQPVR